MANQEKDLKRIYQEVKGILDELPPSSAGERNVDRSIAHHYNSLVDELTEILKIDCSKYKIESVIVGNRRDVFYRLLTLRPKGSSLLGFLKVELNIKEDVNNNIIQPFVNISNQNQNQNTLMVNIQTTINQLIGQEEDGETKKQLQELDEALTKKDGSRVKKALLWLLDKSFDLVIQILPEIFKRYNQ